MVKAEKLPSGNYRVRVYIGTDENGRKIRKSFTAATKRDAELLAAQYAASKHPAADLTVGEAIDKYIQSKNNVLSPSTLRSYRTMRKNYLSSIIDTPLSTLDSKAVQAAVNIETASLSAKSVRNIYGLLTAALAVYAPEIRLRVTLPKKQKRLRAMPDPADIIRIIRGTEIELPCLLALWCSLRMSEVRGLKRSDIVGDCMYIRSAIVTVEGHHIEKQSTKTYDSERISNVPTYIRELINALPEDQEHITELTGQAIYKRFIRLQEKNNINPRISFHDLRHMNASIMVKLHIPDKYAMERGGWSTASTLRNVYQHTFSEERQAVNEAIDNYFNGIINKQDVGNSVES